MDGAVTIALDRFNPPFSEVDAWGEPRGFSVELIRAALIAGILLSLPASAADTGLVPYRIVGDAVPAPLTSTAGDPARGRAIVADRRIGLCLLCHSGPFPEAPLQGNLAPSLTGAKPSPLRIA